MLFFLQKSPRFPGIYHLQIYISVQLNVYLQIIAIGNAGLSCGFSQEDVKRELQISIKEDDRLQSTVDHELDQRIFLLPDQPFALIECCCCLHAKRLLFGLINRIIILRSGQVIPWYPAFITNSESLMSAID
jgi:hypothetical protein